MTSGARASYSAPQDLLSDATKGEQVRRTPRSGGMGGRERGGGGGGNESRELGWMLSSH